MTEALVLRLLLVLLRVSAFVTFVPIFRGGHVPQLVKIGLVVALTWLWSARTAAVDAGLLQTLGWLEMAFLVTREVVLGASFGFVAGLLLESARMAGAYLGQELGLSLASIADPQTGQANGIVAIVFESVAFLLFLSLNVHHVLLRAIDLSFNSFPVGQAWSYYPFAVVARQTSAALHLGMLIAAPPGVCLFLVVIVLGLLARAVPQMNIFSVGLAVRVGAGMLAMLLFLPSILTVMARVLERAVFLVDNFP